MTTEDFSGVASPDLPFAVGSVRGTRSFALDDLGRLTGVSYKSVWTPGENTAECLATNYNSMLASMAALNQALTFYSDPWPIYTYVDGKPAAVTSGGYVDPAKSTGLTNKPPADGYPKDRKRKAKKEKLPDATTFTLDPGHPGVVTIGNADPSVTEEPKVEKEHSMADCKCGFYGYGQGSNDFYKPGYVTGVVEAWGETMIGTRGFRASKARILALYIPEDIAIKHGGVIRRNYSSIPFFNSFESMLAEYPPDLGEYGTDPTTDSDFWTKQA